MLTEPINTRVLIIDDEEIVRDNIEDILVPNRLHPNESIVSASSILFGDDTVGQAVVAPAVNRTLPTFQVDKAVNGMEGVEMIKQAIKRNAPYSVIFLDMRMPGWDGLETAQQIRMVDMKAEIIIITAFSDKSIDEIVEKAGQNVGYHCKPYAAEEIIQLATKAVNDYHKLRNLEKLISVISSLNVSQTHLDSLLQNILDQLTMYIGSHTALLGKLHQDSTYEPLFSIGAIDEEINIGRVKEIIASASFNEEEVEQIGELIFVKLDHYTIFAVISKEFHLKTEKLYLLKLFVQNAAKAIKNLQLREELIQKEKLSAVGKALGMLMHDLRTPIKNIPLLTNVMREEGIASEWLDLIDECGHQASAIFDDFLDFLRDTPLELKPVLMTQLLKNSLDTATDLIGTDSVVIERSIESGLLINGDKGKLHRIVTNILNNAVEACLEHQVEQPVIQVTATRSNGHALLTIRDNGPGIPEKIMHTLYDPFVTSQKKNGTGLGLAIVKQYIEAHGGTISVANTPGAEFTIQLPLLF
jgi:two-component system, NtrC family, sensor kinase